jgi:phospho-N-acetylmuramoyl-pentapeptide-transferase
MVPFFSDLAWVLSPWFYVVFVGFVVSGTANAVNLTDGLDGLATGLMAIAASAFAVFAYLLGNINTSGYLLLFYLPGAGELSVLALAVAGGCLGFLWYNTHPAEVFMGDTGSLALGGVLGAMAILLKAEFLLVIVGGVFVVEVLSVILQVGFFKYTRWRHGTSRRLFRMAPIHHHFEQLGWTEDKVVVRFWIMGILCAMVAFSALKIR